MGNGTPGDRSPRIETAETVEARGWRATARVACLAACLVVAFGACSASTDTSPPSGSAPGSTGTAVGSTLPFDPDSAADVRGRAWPVYGHDLANTRTNTNETAINPSTVARLTPGWTKDGLVGVTGTPTVADGVAYFGDWKGMIWAVRTIDGEALWSSPIGGMIVGAPAVDGDGVFASSGHTLHRLDRRTGEKRWQAETNEHPLAQISASPVVVDGLVLQGVASAEVVMARAEYTFRGSIGAYDAATGREVWRFFTTPNDATSGAGVGVWSTPAVDRERGVLYVGSGNNYAEPTGPLADSILAIDYRTGALRWSRQFTNPDVFSGGNPKGKDADVGASPNLWMSGDRAMVGAGDKGGVYHAVDRDTGELVWETTLTPGSVFGGEIGSGAYVDDKLVVVSNVGDPATNAPTNVARAFALDPDDGTILWRTADYAGKIFAPVGAVPGVAFIGTDLGTLVALATVDGTQLWSHDAPDKTGCGPSIVDGRVLWGYGFVLFQGGGQGGLLSFTVGAP